jgi:formylglycine-generating enzyme required for sulfatase activity
MGGSGPSVRDRPPRRARSRLGRRLSRIAAAGVIAAAAWTALACAAFAAPGAKIALVIGNTTYGSGLQQLPLASVDAQMVADALRKAGYVDASGAPVKPATDLSSADLIAAVRGFEAQLAAAPEGAVGFIYFAGHGLARERRGDVYLLPVDATLKGPQVDVDAIGVPLADLLQLLRGHKGRTVVVVVDACRNVPPVNMVSGRAPTRSVEGSGSGSGSGSGWGDDEDSGGLGLLSRAAGRDFSGRTPDSADYFVAFSTSPDRAAYDTDLFSKIMADELTKGRHDVLTLFKKVGERMAAETRASGVLQLPTYEVGIYGQPPCFGGCPPESDPSHFFDCAGCPWMRVIRPGPFTMGSPPTEPGRDRDEPAAQPSLIARAFAIGEYEVTRAEWIACERAGVCRQLSQKNPLQTSKAPIGGITLADAKSFLAWLSKRSGVAYRLPTEAEWEYAARAGAATPFHFGDRIDPSLANYDYSTSYLGSPRAEYLGASMAVGSFPPNAFNLFDMLGNVWEWTWSCAPDAAAACTDAALRGGSFRSSARELRAANRFRIKPDDRREDVGLRVARDVPG